MLRAPMDGVAWTFGGCPSDTSRMPDLQRCNLGFGNIVRLEHPSGGYVQFAHLAEIHVQWGAPVRAGDSIGVEGSSGNAGPRHLHLSVHEGDPRALIPGPSVPFILQTAQGDLPSTDLPCDDFMKSSEIGPHAVLSGVLLPREKPLTYAHSGGNFDELAAWATASDPSLRALASTRLAHDPSAAGQYWYAVSLAAPQAPRGALRAAHRIFRGLAQQPDPPWIAGWAAVQRCRVLTLQGATNRSRACAAAARPTATPAQADFLDSLFPQAPDP